MLYDHILQNIFRDFSNTCFRYSSIFGSLDTYDVLPLHSVNFCKQMNVATVCLLQTDIFCQMTGYFEREVLPPCPREILSMRLPSYFLVPYALNLLVVCLYQIGGRRKLRHNFVKSLDAADGLHHQQKSAERYAG